MVREGHFPPVSGAVDDDSPDDDASPGPAKPTENKIDGED
jgi:hypothetical protein